MNPLFDTMAVQVIGFLYAANKSQVEHLVDDAAKKIVAAVYDSDTKIDDAAATALAECLERLSAKVREGLSA